MASWGLMKGLGEGLQSVGKTMLAEELAKRREARAEELAQRKEQREAARNRTTPQDTRYVKRDGVWWEDVMGGEENVLESRLAPQNKIEEFKAEEEERKRKAEADATAARKALADAALSENRARDYDADREFNMEMARQRSSADMVRANNSGSRRALDAPVEYSAEEVIDLIGRSNKSTFDAIAKKYPDYVNPTDYMQMVRRAQQDADERGINANAYLQDILMRYEQKLRDRAKTAPSSSTGRPGRSLEGRN